MTDMATSRRSRARPSRPWRTAPTPSRRCRSAALRPLLSSELQLARAFGWSGVLTLPAAAPAGTGSPDPGALDLHWLGEGAIRDALLRHIGAATDADSIDIACDSLSDRQLIGALLAAGQ